MIMAAAKICSDGCCFVCYVFPCFSKCVSTMSALMHRLKITRLLLNYLFLLYKRTFGASFVIPLLPVYFRYLSFGPTLSVMLLFKMYYTHCII